jgi:hypothetical protein
MIDLYPFVNPLRTQAAITLLGIAKFRGNKSLDSCFILFR